MAETIQDNSNKKARLGRGLGSLLGGGHSEISSSNNLPAKPQVEVSNSQPAETLSGSSENRVWNVPIEKLQASSFQPRQYFEKEKLQELSQSIREKGVLQPILARKLNSGLFEIIAGERRWRASQLAGLQEVPVIVKTLSNRETLELAIIENVQREDLNPIEEAEAYLRLAQEFSLNQQQIAEKVGKERATVANSMRLLGLPTEVRDMVVKGGLSQGHAKVLLSLPQAQQMVKVAKKTVEEGLSVRQLEKVVLAYKNLLPNATKEVDQPGPPDFLKDLVENLQKKLSTKVTINYHQGKGMLAIQFYSDDELNALIERF